MYKTLFILTIVFFGLTSKTSAQTISNDNGNVVLYVSSNLQDAEYYFTQNFKITNTQTAIISGSFSSDISLVIKPNNTNSITIKPAITLNKSTTTGGGTTVVTTKPTSGTGGLAPGSTVPSHLSIYPNPSTNNLTFSLANNQVISYSIYDTYGNSILSQNITPTNNYTIDVSNLTQGNYLLKLNLDIPEYLTIQFIKN